MKRLFVLLLAAVLICTTANAQGGFGIKGGVMLNSMSDIKITDMASSVKSKTGFHAGVLYKIKLPLGFALQPELMYVSTASSMRTEIKDLSLDFKTHSIQLPVGLQWGIDLVLFRPYLQFVPYIGYAIAKGKDLKDVAWDDINRFEYGLGIGAGIEIWKFQLSGRYSWELGKANDFQWKNLNKQISKGNTKGFELSLAFIF